MDVQVTLAAYAEQNRALIHNGRSNEAIAIGKHILHYYPKHVDSYRQLGEAYLEQGALDDAKDMFRRVLSADPENVIAYVGLASIFEQQHLIDEAVWHLERAYELAPGNFEISKELDRLLSETGKPHQRLKLTAAGLARLYTQEGLSAQAIQELRLLSTSAPARLDIRLALAEALWHAGRIREAADLAQALLTPLPYCLKANLLLGTAWKESSLAESDAYLNRAQELDPTNQVAARLLGSRSPLALAQISVPRYVEGAAPPPAISPTPIPIEPPLREPARPRVDAAARETTDFFADTSASEIATPPSPTPPALSSESASESMPKPNLPVANLPPWLLSEFPEPAADKTATRPELPSAVETPPAEVEPRAEELPAWLRESTPSTEPAQPALEESQPSSQTDTETHAASVEQTTAASAPQEEIPDWLRALQASSPAANEPESAPPAAPAASQVVAEPAVLPEISGAARPAEEPSTVPAAASEPSAEDRLPSFLAPPSAKVEPSEEPIAAAESTPPPEFAAEMPPAPAAAQSAPPIVVEMPTPETPAESEVQKVAKTPPSAPATSRRSRQPKGYAHLVLAREHRDASRLGDALGEYDYLVQHAPGLVNAVIDDLEILTARADTPLEAHRVLGDAYSRADRLAEALQRYQYVLERTSTS